MPYGNRPNRTGDILLLVFCAALLGVATFCDIRYHDKQSCERAEAVNDAYMRGFRAGQLEGIRESIERVEAMSASRNEDTRQP